MSKVKDKIKKLLALSKSPNEHEAALALEIAVKLAAENDMSIEAIQTEQEKALEIREFQKMKSRLPPWEGHLAREVARLFGCYTYIHSISGINPTSWTRFQKKGIKCCGCAADIEIAQYLYEYLRRQLVRMGTQYSKRLRKPKPSRIDDYRLGVTLNVLERASEVFAQQSEAGGIYALIVRRYDIAKRHIEETIEFSNARKRKAKMSRKDLEAGYDDGDDVAINKPIASERRQLKEGGAK